MATSKMGNGRKLAKKDSKKSFELPEKKFVELEQKFSSQTAIDIGVIQERVKLVKEAMSQPENLIRTESHDGYVTKFYNVEKLGVEVKI